MRQPFDARGTGVKKILKDHGISVISTEIEWNIVSYEYYAQVVEKYLDLFDDVDGIYVGDLPAVACMAVAEKRGIRVPEEILKFIGYDGIGYWKICNPPFDNPLNRTFPEWQNVVWIRSCGFWMVIRI